jgi:uncharacterized membrane protein
MAYQAAISVPTRIAVNKIRLADLVEALDRGIDDFKAKPTHLFFLAVIYPLATLFGYLVVDNYNLMPLVFPILAGLVLIGPFVGIAMEEMSHHRERGLDMSWRHAFNFFEEPTLKEIVLLGLLIVALFLGWVAMANTIFVMTVGDAWNAATITPQEFLRAVLTTSQGWVLIVVGNAVGLLFAIASLTIGAISFPLLLDKKVGLGTAVETSVRAVLANPLPMAVWGLVVAFSLLLGAIPLLVGLALVVPILGHATWHLYRKMVAA